MCAAPESPARPRSLDSREQRTAAGAAEVGRHPVRGSLSAANVVTWCDIIDAQSLNGSIGSDSLEGTHRSLHVRWFALASSFTPTRPAPIIQYCTFPDMFAPNENPITLGIDNGAEQIKSGGNHPCSASLPGLPELFRIEQGHNDSSIWSSGQWAGSHRGSAGEFLLQFR
jgi:hypothetical protein